MEGFVLLKKIYALTILFFLINTPFLIDCQNGNSNKILIKMLRECGAEKKNNNVGFCLKIKTANFLEKLDNMKDPLFLTDYLALVKKQNVSNGKKKKNFFSHLTN